MLPAGWQAPPLSLYVHIPWCISKCPYCDFNSHAYGEWVDEKGYVQALLMDLEQDLALLPRRTVETVFFGGGTPSLFDADVMVMLLQGISDRVAIADDAEITLEANPGAADAAKFEVLAGAGVNRLSIGVQSFDDGMLQALGRVHSSREASQAYGQARAAGFTNINLDLMFGLPRQTPEQAMRDLETAIYLRPEHISWYQLTIEPNTLFHHSPPEIPDDELLWEIQQQGQQKLQDAGYMQYEVSAYALQGKSCRHNRNYWSFGDYLGVGAGAHGKLTTDNEVLRTWKIRGPAAYQSTAVEGGEVRKQKRLGNEDLRVEFMLNALRLNDGVEMELFRQRTGLPPDAIAESRRLSIQRGLLCDTPRRLQATELGRRFLNDLVGMFG